MQKKVLNIIKRAILREKEIPEMGSDQFIVWRSNFERSEKATNVRQYRF